MSKENISKKLNLLHSLLNEVNNLKHIQNVLSYDEETICPKKALFFHDENIIFISNQIFKITNSHEYKNVIIELHKHIKEVDSIYDKRLIEVLFNRYLDEAQMDENLNTQFSEVMTKGFASWINAKEQNDYSLFKDTLSEILAISKKVKSISLKPSYSNLLNQLMDDYEEGMTTEILDPFFEKIKGSIIPLLKQIKNSKVKIRTDFINRKVPHCKQIEFANYLLETIGFDFSRGVLGEAEHPFTNSLNYDDHRVTTHVYEDNFISNMYSVIHEGGHAIFGQSIPKIMYDHHIDSFRSLGEDESSSRFFENIIGRSRSFIKLIYPKFQEIFCPIFNDVSEEDLYLAVNQVVPGPIRTESDELTYTLHIIIRYELEKEIVNNNISLDNLNLLWNKKYKEYLGVEVESDKDGILQDVHRSSGFGYFPTYAIGNAYNSMYFEKMKNDLDVNKLIESNNIKEVTNWLQNNIYEKASYLSPKEWIVSIVGKELEPDAFINYLETKYKEIYNI